MTIFTGPPETKVALPAFAGLVTSLVAQVLQEYAPGIKPPSTTLVALSVTTIIAIVGYLSPHTHQYPAPTLKPVQPDRIPGAVTFQ